MTDTFKPTDEIATAAKRALRWIADGYAGSGFTDVGRRRASQLANREAVSLDTVKRMYSFFSRHEVDKKGKDFANLSEPSAGRVAWDAWGGDAGYAWSKRIVESMSDKSVTVDTATAFMAIVKADKQPDGTLLVTGKATDDSLDSDQQVCDPTWLKTAMPEWFQWGNIREQHSNIAAGVATEYAAKGSEHWITAKVVDPASVKKVEAGVLKGFSIGIRNPRVVKDDKAAGGRITDGTIVEVSLVDRPANPTCTLTVAKAVGSEVVQVEELTENATDLLPKSRGEGKKEMHMSEETTEETTAGEESTPEVTEETTGEETTAEETTEESTEATPAGEESTAPGEEKSSEESVVASTEETKAMPKMCKDCGKLADDCKCAEGGFSREEKAVEESSQKPDEESSQKPGEESSRPGGVAGVAGKSDDDQLTRIESLLHTLLETQQELAKSLDREDIAKSVQEVTERVSKVEKAAKPGGAVRMAVGTPEPVVDENFVKAQEYRAKALAATNPTLAQGYLALALDHESKINK